MQAHLDKREASDTVQPDDESQQQDRIYATGSRQSDKDRFTAAGSLLSPIVSNPPVFFPLHTSDKGWWGADAEAWCLSWRHEGHDTYFPQRQAPGLRIRSSATPCRYAYKRVARRLTKQQPLIEKPSCSFSSSVHWHFFPMYMV
jgi:hypothetical protein